MENQFIEELKLLVDSFGPENQDGVKEALRLCQEMFDCVSKMHQAQIAEHFAVPAATISVLMKFNKSLKESKVKHEIICCNGGRCSKNGSLEILQTLCKNLGIHPNQCTPDGHIYLRTQNCFKKCNQGPNMMVDGFLYSGLSIKEAERIVSGLK